MSVIKAVIFDLDGVLIDAREWHYEALNQSLRMFGFEINRYDHLSSFDGLPTRKKLERLTLERGLPKGLHGLINRVKQRYTMDAIHARCRPLFQHQYAISHLKNSGYRLGVCSNSIRPTVEVTLQKAGLIDYLDIILSAEDVERPKPDSEMYDRAIRALELSPEAVLVVEDNENGIRAARASGAHVLEVEGVEDVTHEAITRLIRRIEEVPSC